jgi:NAD(P)-dependent dehydrogenase (short-subunit alcohol dehydrogenase family)
MRFQDKIAIVTGGASGMGKEIASRFVAEGGSVIVNGRDTAKTEAAANQIDPSGKRAVGYVGNVALPAVGEALVKTAIDRFGRLDVLFNNAGIFGPKPFLEVNEAEYDRFLDNILKDAFFTAQAAAKAMKARRPRRRYCADRFDVGAAGDRRDAVLSLFRGEGRRACANQESRDRIGALQDPSKCDRARGNRDAGLQYIPLARAGSGCAADL